MATSGRRRRQLALRVRKTLRGATTEPHPGVWMTDLRDVIGPDGDLGDIRKGTGHFVAAVVEASTARPSGRWGDTVVHCTLRRPSRSKCDGLVRVRLDDSSDVLWQCVACGNEGAVQGWQASPFDLRRARDARPRGQVASVTLSVAEYEAIKDSLMMGADHPEVLAAASRGDDGSVVIRATPGEIESLCDAVAAEANHAPTRRGQRVLDSAFERLRGALEPAPLPRQAHSFLAASDARAAESLANGIAAMLGASPDAESRYRGIFVETARAVLEAHALQGRIRKAASTIGGKAPLIQVMELSELLDQAATFSRSQPRDGVPVLVAFVESLRGTTLTEDLAPLIFEAARALLVAAKGARDSRAVRDAMHALVNAHINDARFGAVASALDGARLGKRATKTALDELARVGDAMGDDARGRAANLTRTLAGRHLS